MADPVCVFDPNNMAPLRTAPDSIWDHAYSQVAPELPLDDGCTLILDAVDPTAPEDVPVFLVS